MRRIVQWLEEQEGVDGLPSHAALMASLEAQGLLDRAVAGLPDAAALRARMAAGEVLARPEIAALLPVAKLWLKEPIVASALPDDAAFEPALLAYFPGALPARFGDLIKGHRLRRELIATALANAAVNRLGLPALARLSAEADPVRVARAAWLASELFDLEAICDAIDAAPAPVEVRLSALLTVGGGHSQNERRQRCYCRDRQCLARRRSSRTQPRHRRM